VIVRPAVSARRLLVWAFAEHWPVGNAAARTERGPRPSRGRHRRGRVGKRSVHRTACLEATVGFGLGSVWSIEERWAGDRGSQPAIGETLPPVFSGSGSRVGRPGSALAAAATERASGMEVSGPFVAVGRFSACTWKGDGCWPRRRVLQHHSRPVGGAPLILFGAAGSRPCPGPHPERKSLVSRFGLPLQWPRDGRRASGPCWGCRERSRREPRVFTGRGRVRAVPAARTERVRTATKGGRGQIAPVRAVRPPLEGAVAGAFLALSVQTI